MEKGKRHMCERQAGGSLRKVLHCCNHYRSDSFTSLSGDHNNSSWLYRSTTASSASSFFPPRHSQNYFHLLYLLQAEQQLNLQSTPSALHISSSMQLEMCVFARSAVRIYYWFAKGITCLSPEYPHTFLSTEGQNVWNNLSA